MSGGVLHQGSRAGSYEKKDFGKRFRSNRFGESFRLKQDVRTMIVSRLPISAQLVGLAFLFSTLVSLPLGILAAAKEGTWVDAVSSLIALIGVSTQCSLPAWSAC